MAEHEMTFAEFEQFVLALGPTTGAIALHHFRRPLAVDNKAEDGFDPVTEADRAVEQTVRAALAGRYPTHGILGEEAGERVGTSAYRWFVDPIDGTRSFVIGSPLWGTLIGVAQGAEPRFGALCQPVLRETFLGGPGEAWLIDGPGHRTRLRTRHCAHLADAMLASTHPDMFVGVAATAYETLRGRCRLDRYGGDCYNYALLAMGFVDLVVEAELKPYDIVPLIPVIEGAGGVVTDWQGRSALAGGAVIAAATRELHAEALEVLQQHGG